MKAYVSASRSFAVRLRSDELVMGCGAALAGMVRTAVIATSSRAELKSMVM